MNLDNISLVFPTAKHEKMWENILLEFESVNEKVIPSALKLNCGIGNYREFLQKTIDFANNIMPPELPHLVKATTYFLINKNIEKILGAVSIRHSLNDYLMNVGGNIGYGVAPSERRKGYATHMLSLALIKCREFGLEKVLVTCNNDNIGSAKTIINNEGILENEYLEENGNIVQRYWISL